MKVAGRHTRSIWLEPDGATVGIVDQTRLPHRFETTRLATLADAAHAIRTMQVRGAPLIGATAAYGICLPSTFMRFSFRGLRVRAKRACSSR